MSPLFAINFRREAYLKEVARTRRRVIALGVWVSYFGAIGLMLGLYGLNCAALNRRVAILERQTERVRGAQGATLQWNVRPGELGQIESYVMNSRQWRDRLAHLSIILPPNARLKTLALNPQNLGNAADQNLLVISGELRATPGQDRMQGVMKIVSAVHDDSVFAASYRNIKLASTRVEESTDGTAEFVIECR